MTAHQTLLADYVAKGSEQAFAELVGHYLNLVYSMAVRLVDGVTIKLATKAASGGHRRLKIICYLFPAV
jgi:hypothetical protein